MCKILRNKELLLIFSRKRHPKPFSIGPGTRTQIHSHVKHFSFYHADQLVLGIVYLEMKATQYIFYRCGLIILYKDLINSGLFKIIIIIRLHEIAPGITKNGRCNHL